jgi:hypothetical protein
MMFPVLGDDRPSWLDRRVPHGYDLGPARPLGDGEPCTAGRDRHAFDVIAACGRASDQETGALVLTCVYCFLVFGYGYDRADRPQRLAAPVAVSGVVAQPTSRPFLGDGTDVGQVWTLHRPDGIGPSSLLGSASCERTARGRVFYVARVHGDVRVEASSLSALLRKVAAL